MRNDPKENCFPVSLVQTGVVPLKVTCIWLTHGCCVCIQTRNTAKTALTSVFALWAFLFSDGNQGNWELSKNKCFGVIEEKAHWFVSNSLDQQESHNTSFWKSMLWIVPCVPELTLSLLDRHSLTWRQHQMRNHLAEELCKEGSNPVSLSSSALMWDFLFHSSRKQSGWKCLIRKKIPTRLLTMSQRSLPDVTWCSSRRLRIHTLRGKRAQLPRAGLGSQAALTRESWL